MSAPSSWPSAIRALLAELAASGVEEFEFAVADTRLRIRRQPGRAAAPLAMTAVAASAAVSATIVAPLAGIFYRAASPGAEPFVHEGDEIAPGQPIGLIEAMKVFNEVRADRGGRVVRFLVENGQLVGVGDPLLELEEAE
ncbi:MAG: acetyl-CoA carboxylase biotin carboxyl carrier protein subunit [Dehalococcoidia bacterium]|nr:MAG: acetyl-CoA carboxylase biotin carboxyl carrier protein subunit [Dehalococcoidia bacterium]